MGLIGPPRAAGSLYYIQTDNKNVHAPGCKVRFRRNSSSLPKREWARERERKRENAGSKQNPDNNLEEMCPAVQSSAVAAWNKHAIGNVMIMVITDWNIISFIWIYNVAEKAVFKQTHTECIHSHLHISGTKRGIKRQGREKEGERKTNENVLLNPDAEDYGWQIFHCDHTHTHTKTVCATETARPSLN